jgi:signal transduction histidine kinase
LSAWQIKKQMALRMIDHLRVISIKDSAQQENIKETDRSFRIITVVMEKLIALPEDLTERIFERFVQVDKSDAIDRGGSGLGLAIAKMIVEQHGGKQTGPAAMTSFTK